MSEASISDLVRTYLDVRDHTQPGGSIQSEWEDALNTDSAENAHHHFECARVLQGCGLCGDTDRLVAIRGSVESFMAKCWEQTHPYGPEVEHSPDIARVEALRYTNEIVVTMLYVAMHQIGRVLDANQALMERVDRGDSLTLSELQKMHPQT